MSIKNNKVIKVVYGFALCVVLSSVVFVSLVYAESGSTLNEKPTLALKVGQTLTPVFSVTVGSDQKIGVVQLFSDSACNSALSERVLVSSSGTADVQAHTLTSGQSYTVYAKHILPSYGGSQCSASGVDYEYGVPAQDLVAPSLVLNSAKTGEKQSNPTFTVTVDSSQKNGVVQLFSDDSCASALSERVLVSSGDATDVQAHTLTSGQSYTVYARHSDKYDRNACSVSGVEYVYTASENSGTSRTTSKTSRTASKKGSANGGGSGAGVASTSKEPVAAADLSSKDTR